VELVAADSVDRYALGPNGTLLILRPTEGGVRELRLVLDWLNEVRTLTEDARRGG